MYILKRDNAIIGKYQTKQEALYYKKQNPDSRVFSKYTVCDLNKDILSKDTEILAESPKGAILEYIKKENLDIKVKADLSGTGRFVVYGNRTSKVYKEEAKLC